MDLSNPGAMLPRSRSTTGGLLKSLLLLGGAMLGAAAGGWLVLLGLRLVWPAIPAWAALVAGTLVLALLLRLIAARWQWIMPWYYVVPAILFLLTFTFFPVGLTFYLAFTDYAGIRNGQLNISSNTDIVGVDGTTVVIADPRILFCSQLSNGCNGVRAVVYSSEQYVATGEGLEDNVLTLAEPLPAGRAPQQLELFLPSLGFNFSVAVLESDGTDLVLERAPPFPPELENIRIQLADSVPRRIVSEDGATLVLDQPLPDGFEATGIARYNDYGFIGWRNFRDIIGRAQRSLVPVFTWNVAFAFLTIIINTVAGVFLAVLLNNPNLRGRNVYRTLLILPWALPTIITIQVWRGLLNEGFGAVNRLLMLFDITGDPVNWLGEAWAARAAILLVNLWLGLPYMMTATLSALSAIPRELYEAARIDGASAWQGFASVTAPLLRAAMVPILLTSFAFNFNNFNLIFLLTDGGPAASWGTATARSTDILISWAYNEAFRSQGGYAYGLGSAISILIFVITLAISLVNFRVTGALREERKA